MQSICKLGYTLTILLLLSSVAFVCAVILGDGSSSVTLTCLKVFSIQIILRYSSLYFVRVYQDLIQNQNHTNEDS